MKGLSKVTAALCLSLCVIGCAGPYQPKFRVERKEFRPPVLLLDKQLKKQIEIRGERTEYTSDGRLSLSVTLFNKTKDEISFFVQTVFKDQEGFSTGDETNWQQIIMQPFSTETYSSVSLNSKAKRYETRIHSFKPNP